MPVIKVTIAFQVPLTSVLSMGDLGRKQICNDKSGFCNVNQFTEYMHRFNAKAEPCSRSRNWAVKGVRWPKYQRDLGCDMSDESDTDQHSDDKVLQADDVRGNHTTNRWGIWAAPEKYRTTDGYELIHYWFVQYNPLYVFSALCVLGGVYLLALELDGDAVAGGWSLGQVFLFAVIQFYELLLIAAAGFLVHKVGLIRPAIILMMLEGLFLFDCTFRLETISHLGVTGTTLSVVWVVLAPVKVWLLGRALRIDIPRTVIWLVAGGAAGLALMLQTLAMPEVNRAMIILVATWWGAALVAFVVIVKPRISRSSTPDIASDEVSKRISKSLLMLLGGIYFYHVFNYVAWVGVDGAPVFGPMLGTVFLMVALLRLNEREIWVGAALALAASLSYPAATFSMCVLATVVLLYRALQSGNARFLVGAVLTGYFATWVFAWAGEGPPLPPMWSTVVAGSLLGYLAWKLREPAAVLVLAVGGLGIAGRYDFNPMYLLPQTRLGVGILLIVAGFLALTVGLWVNWWFRSPPRTLDHGEEECGAPDSATQSEL
jgi:hypothetical protein